MNSLLLYIGPGVGLATVVIVIVVLLLVLGSLLMVVWTPIKLFFKRLKSSFMKKG